MTSVIDLYHFILSWGCPLFRQLIDELRSKGPLQRDGADVGELLAACGAQWAGPQQLTFRPGAYTRTCAYQDPGFEVVLLNWAPGAASAIHDHGDQHCWMFVLEGRLCVDDYRRLDPGDVPGYAVVEMAGTRGLDPGGLDLRSGRFDLHRVSAGDAQSAVSLHIYARPLREYLVYDREARRCEAAFGTYDALLCAPEPAR